MAYPLRRTLALVAMTLVPLTWLLVLYGTWFSHDDCWGALRQIGGLDSRLHASLTGECEAAEARLWLTGAIGLVLVLTAEWLLWRSIRSGRR